mmetsp:Transcript_45114/g.109777  ORF Transcript_45114/g.109777 Transcript_45114/m.109777 type:complete len:604 (+) Transcript_45114:185-1996(+)
MDDLRPREEVVDDGHADDDHDAVVVNGTTRIGKLVAAKPTNPTLLCFKDGRRFKGRRCRIVVGVVSLFVFLVCQQFRDVERFSTSKMIITMTATTTANTNSTIVSMATGETTIDFVDSGSTSTAATTDAKYTSNGDKEIKPTSDDQFQQPEKASTSGAQSTIEIEGNSKSQTLNPPINVDARENQIQQKQKQRQKSSNPNSRSSNDDDDHSSNDNTPVVSVVVSLSGELGNNLHHLAHGIGLQEWLRQEFDVESNIVIRHHKVGKWKKAYDDIQTCFPILAEWDFTAGNSKQFDRLEKLQKEWLNDRHDQVIALVNSGNLTNVRQGLYRLAKNILHDTTRPNITTTTTTLRVPFIVSLTILDAFPVIDRHFDTIRRIFAYNHSNPECCALFPTRDETVFHFRNYFSELPDIKAYNMGFAELSPNKTAYELFGSVPEPTATQGVETETSTTIASRKAAAPELMSSSSRPTMTMTPRLSPGDKVSVLSRIPNKYARAYAERLNGVWGTNATLLSYGQSGLQDFCYMMHARHELVGNGRSTFLFWAAALGPEIQNARLYHDDTFGLRNKFPDFWTRFTYQWTHPDLKKRIHWELYKSEEVDDATTT